jgi:uncharacterized protein
MAMESTAASERIAAMDFLRGVALFGILVVNLPYFALASERASAFDASEAALETAVLAAVTWLFVTKFFTLFSLLFGMGLVLQMERAKAGEQRFTRLYPRRLSTLAVFGVLHGVFLFMGDILLVYSVAGFVLYALRGATPRRLARLAAVFFVVGAVLSVVVAGIDPPAGPTGDVPTWAPSENVTLAQIVAHVDDEAAWSAVERKAFADGPYPSTLLVNATDFVGWLLVSSLISFNWRVLACFLVGAALMKAGLFRPDRRRWWVAFASIGLPVGLACEGFTVRTLLETGSDSVREPMAVLVNEIGSTALSFGYLGAILLFTASGRASGFRRLVEAAGRMALTNYILQSVVANVIFRWWGLDLYEELSRVQILAIAIAVFLGQVAASAAWLARYPMGPLEHLWRKLTYG